MTTQEALVAAMRAANCSNFYYAHGREPNNAELLALCPPEARRVLLPSPGIIHCMVCGAGAALAGEEAIIACPACKRRIWLPEERTAMARAEGEAAGRRAAAEVADAVAEEDHWNQTPHGRAFASAWALAAEEIARRIRALAAKEKT